MMIAELKGAGKEYKTGDQTIVALQPTDFQLNEGELTLIIGPSGSGKTTLLSMLGCVIYPSYGDLWVDGKHINELKERQLARLRLETIGFVFQSFNLLAPLSAEENVELPLKLLEVGKVERKRRVQKALETVGMTDRRKSLPKALSGGQQQRIAIARALAVKPSLIVCDEPTSALDVSVQAQILNLLRELQDSLGVSYLFVTHNIGVVAYLADRVAVMHAGEIVEMGDASQILNDPQDAYTKTLLSAVPKLNQALV
jgi:putative ABC transport system ATP-binding protein